MAEARETRSGLPTGLLAALTFVLGVVALLFLLRDDDGRAVRIAPLDFDVRGFEEQIEARLDPVALRPAEAFRVRVTRVAWLDGTGRPFLRVPAAVFTVDFSAGGGALRIANGVVTSPEVHLVRSPGGAWNHQRALSGLTRSNGGERGRDGGGLAVTLADIVVRGGAVTVDLPDTDFAARSVGLRLASARLSGPGVAAPTFEIASAEAVLELPDTARGTVTRAVALDRARVRLLDGGVAFEVSRGRFGSSTFADASGVWNPELGGLGLDATLRAEDFRLADLPWLRAEVPTEATGSFRLRIQPAGRDRTAVALTDLTLTAPGSSATGSLRAVFGDAGFTLDAIDLRVDPLALALVEAFTGPLPYTGTLRGTLQGRGGDIRFDVTARLATSPAAAPFETQLTGEVSFTAAGLALNQVTTTLDQVPLSALEAIAPGLPLAGAVSGTVSLTGLPSEEPVRLNVRLEVGGGIAIVEGIVDLTGAVPAYDLGGRLVGVELRQVFDPAMPPAQVHATFDLDGAGTELATADARLRLDGTFTGWRSEPTDTVAVVAALSGGRLDVDTGRLELGPVSLTAAGEWAMVGGGGGAIRYALEVGSLEPLAPYLPPDEAGRPRFARGSLQAEGQVAGTLEDPFLTGEVQARDFRFGEWAADRLDGTYTARFTGTWLPTIQAEVAGTEIRSPAGDFETLRVDVDFTRPTFALAVVANQAGGGILQVEAGGRIEEAGGREIELRRVEIDLEDQRWRLPSPGRITWTAGEAVLVEGLRLERTGGDGLLRVDGIVAPFDQADFAVDIRNLPIGELLDVAGMDVDLRGDLTVDGRVRGPAESPDIALQVLLTEGVVRDIPIRSIETDVRYAGAELTFEGTGVLADSAYVEVSGRLPSRLALGLPPAFELLEGREVEVTLVTDDFPLQTLDPGIRSVQDLEGLLRADVRIAGTPAEPRLTGDVELVDGEVTVPMLDKRYTGIEGLATLSGRQLTVRRMVAHSGGTATVTGAITFAELTNPTFDLTATLDRFEPQGVSNADDAVASGTLRLSGSLADPVLSGRVAMDGGTVSLVPFTGGPALGDRLVGVAESFAPITSGELDVPGTGEPFVRVTDLELIAGNDLWFATEEARAQLRGTLDIATVGNDLTLQGTLEGEQGTFDLRVGPIRRRFNVVAANIRFLGSPEPNPALDITASRRVPTLEGGLIDVRVRVTGNLSNPQIALGSAEGAAIAESELLSLVVFGRQTFTEGDAPLVGQQGLLSEIAVLTGGFDWLTGLAGQADVLQELDQFQIQMRSAGGFDTENLWLIAGEQLSLGAEDVLVTLETPIRQNQLFVIAAEWRIDREWTLELSWEPERYIGATGTGSIPVPLDELDPQRQVLLVIRRRWTY